MFTWHHCAVDPTPQNLPAALGHVEERPWAVFDVVLPVALIHVSIGQHECAGTMSVCGSSGSSSSNSSSILGHTVAVTEYGMTWSPYTCVYPRELYGSDCQSSVTDNMATVASGVS